MLSSILMVVIFILVGFFIFYKRDMLIQMFPMPGISPANRFQEQLEQTADIVLKRLEEQIIHLEKLLEEANEKVTSLDNKIQVANKILNKEHNIIKESLNPLLSSDSINNVKVIENEILMMSIDNYKEMGRSDKRNSIIEMATLGYDITEIAKTTGVSKGEIMLLLQLNKKNNNK